MASTYIDREECIGDSLVKINGNFSGLDTDITNVNTRVTNTSAAAITLTTNLSTNIQKDRYAAKAWVSFEGTGTIGTNQVIHAQYNVNNVVRTAIGSYTIYYTNALSSAINCIIGTAADNSNGRMVHSNFSSITTANITVVTISPLATAPSNYINVVVFGY